MVDVYMYMCMYIDYSSSVVIKGGGPETTSSEGTLHPRALDLKEQRNRIKPKGGVYEINVRRVRLTPS
jgi:hypothetical protein